MEISVTIRFPLPRATRARYPQPKTPRLCGPIGKLEGRARQLHLWHVTAYAPSLLCLLAVGSHLSSICVGRKPLNSRAPHVHVRSDFSPRHRTSLSGVLDSA